MLKLRSQQESLFDGAKVELKELKDSILQYQLKPKQVPLTAVEFVAGECTWYKVKEAVQAAAREEGSDDESWRAKKSCSTIMENIPAFETWLKLLPAGDYGATICGLFQIVVAVSNLLSFLCTVAYGFRGRSVQMTSDF